MGSNSVAIQLQQGLRENLVIPLSDSVAVSVIYIIKYLIADHTEDWYWSAESWNNITESAGIRQPPKKNTKSFHSTCYSSLVTSKTVWYLKDLGKK